jgi:hypothetical protein
MNAINVISPYKYLGMWVFDDAKVGLVQEPFVGGADDIIDKMIDGIPQAEGGFTMLFSASSFPGHQYRLEWVGPEGSGNLYNLTELGMEGWLCPALLRYFDAPPAELFVQVKPASAGSLR